MIHQPVGMIQVVTRHCGPAISTAPDAMSRTGEVFRGIWIGCGTPAIYAKPGTKPYMKTR